MSERKKQVIHVKDLVIEAEHVYVQRSGHRHDQHHEGRGHGEHENRESSNEQHHDHENKEQDRKRRGPFEWF